jgi:hypothetical protein
MIAREFKDNDIPYFCWDRELTAGELRIELQNAKGADWLKLASWIMREASITDVWAFLTPSDVKNHLNELTPYLHRRRDLWQYLIGTWHELGKL